MLTNLQRDLIVIIWTICKAGVESEIAQYPKVVFFNPFCWLTHKANPSMCQVIKTIEVVVQFSFNFGRCGITITFIDFHTYKHRINGEVTTAGVQLPVCCESDLGVSTVRVHVDSQSGHFIIFLK